MPAWLAFVLIVAALLLVAWTDHGDREVLEEVAPL